MSDIKITKPHLIHKRFQMPKGCSIDSFVMREIDGEDEREAGRWIAARESEVDNMSIAVAEEQLKVALVAVNDEPLDSATPFTALNQYSTKTRRLMMEAFGLLNGLEDDEVAVFLGASTDLMGEKAEAEVIDESELAQLKSQNQG